MNSRRTSNVRGECRTFGVTCGKGSGESRKWRVSPTNLWKIGKICAILATIDYCTDGGAYKTRPGVGHDRSRTSSTAPSDHDTNLIMPHLIFQIDEILRPIAEHIGHASRPTAVEFARCCRAFEEPALRPLWENTTLGNLMYVLPKDVLYFGGPGICVVGSLSRHPSV